MSYKKYAEGLEGNNDVKVIAHDKETTEPYLEDPRVKAGIEAAKRTIEANESVIRDFLEENPEWKEQVSKPSISIGKSHGPGRLVNVSIYYGDPHLNDKFENYNWGQSIERFYEGPEGVEFDNATVHLLSNDEPKYHAPGLGQPSLGGNMPD